MRAQRAGWARHWRALAASLLCGLLASIALAWTLCLWPTRDVGHTYQLQVSDRPAGEPPSYPVYTLSNTWSHGFRYVAIWSNAGQINHLAAEHAGADRSRIEPSAQRRAVHRAVLAAMAASRAGRRARVFGVGRPRSGVAVLVPVLPLGDGIWRGPADAVAPAHAPLPADVVFIRGPRPGSRDHPAAPAAARAWGQRARAGGAGVRAAAGSRPGAGRRSSAARALHLVRLRPAGAQRRRRVPGVREARSRGQLSG